MKNIYPRGKGKIHPSPAPPPPPSHDVLVVLKVLPAAILTLTAALSCEDKEVLAYLITRSTHGPAADAERRRGRGGAAAAGMAGHRPLFDCGCFDCYTSFWSRWDCSPDRELIHQAIEAFEEHLASSEKKGGGGGGGSRVRRRERKAWGTAEMGKEKEEEEEEEKKERRKAVMVKEAAVIEEEKLVEGSAVASGEVSNTAEAEAEVGGDEKSGEEKAVAVVGEKRSGWPDLMGLFKSRLWNLWGPIM